jgi:ribosomal protein S18 acetylase RimI-like enzyme
MPDLTLVSMTSQELEAFIDEQVADYAVERMLDGTWSPRDAPERARAGLQRVITWEHEAATVERQRLLTAITSDGQCVGWVWIKLAPLASRPARAFLCQMTVTRALRHHGYGRAMLAALETALAAEGIEELHLNVYEANLLAKCLYAEAGYELVAQHATMRQLRKLLRGRTSHAQHCTPRVSAPSA